MRTVSNVEEVDVTPKLAREWLGYNTHNRRLRDRVVNAYAADMKAGAWQWNGESVKFAKDGTLLDGQHRLAAITLAEVTLRMLVVRGLPNETQDTVDGGAKRKFSDVLQLRGEAHYTTLAALTRRVAMWETGARKEGGNWTPTNAQLLQTLETYPDLREASKIGDHVATRCGLPGSICSFGFWLFGRIDDADAAFFFDRLHDGQNLAKGDPVYELRRVVETSRSVRGQRSSTYLTAIMVKAWNAYRDGKTIALLTFKPGGASPEKFPEPR